MEFSIKTDEDFVEAVNREVGKPGLVSSRGRYVVAPHSELRARDLDIIAVGGLTVIPGPGKFSLHGKRLLYADRPDAKYVLLTSNRRETSQIDRPPEEREKRQV